MFIFSKFAATKYKSMHKFIAQIFLPLALLLASFASADAQVANPVPYQKYTFDTDIFDLRHAAMPNFHYIYDDWTQYAPAALMIGLKAAGYESRTNWKGMLVSDVMSMGIMTVSVKGIKYAVDRTRPYGGHHSFPSGHTARSFMTATMLHKEYGWKNPWYSIGGYTVAAVTGVSRIMNNAHWMSDVLVGAMMGIGSVHLGYYLTDRIFNNRHIYDGYVRPTFEYDPQQRHYAAEMFFARRFFLGGKTAQAQGRAPLRGSIAGVQTDIPMISGAGLTARAYAGSMRYANDVVPAMYSVSAGGYWNCHLARRVELQTRAAAGWANMEKKNGVNLLAGAGLSFFLDDNFKIKGFAEYETIGLLPQAPWMHSILLGYSVGWFW